MDHTLRRVLMVLLGGFPGAGKTHLSKHIATESDFMLIDKDTVSSLFSNKILQLLGSDEGDRHSETYSEEVRGLEYKTMMTVGRENIALGRSVICCAPFSREFYAPHWLQEARQAVIQQGGRLVTIWVSSDHDTARQRIAQRGERRDDWKLTHWDLYLTTLPPQPPPGVDFLVDNSGGPRVAVGKQLETIMEALRRF